MTTGISRLNPAGRRRSLVLAVAASLALLSLAAVPATSSAAAGPGKCGTGSAPSRVGGFGGIVHPTGTRAECGAGAKAEAPYKGTPPLLNHGGPVMAVPSVGSTVVVTPIYWAPAGYSFPAGYKTIINNYLADIAADSGTQTNVFSTNTQYPGSNGAITYSISTTAAVNDTHAYPAAGCVVNSGSVYSDGSGYSTCLDDAQLKAEIATVTSARGLASDFGHLYPILTPKGVESCFYPGNPSNQACTINPTASAAFCAYHGYFGSAGSPTVIANMPFPVYKSATGYSCTAENLDGDGIIQTPNGNVDADVEVSPLSHEMSEAITDPELNAWYDSSGNENGDDCAYIYGTLSGAPHVHYNQVINSRHYLTQEEFSNADFVPSVSGCLQGTGGTPVAPSVTAVTPVSGPLAGGRTVVITGTGFTGATAVKFGATSSTFTVNSATKITATSPAHAAGQINIRVTTPLGTSAIVAADRYRYQNAPSVSAVSPNSGSTSGGQVVTITGTNFTGASAVKFGTAAATFTVNSATKITATSPAHAAGLANVRVTTPSGTSPIATTDHYTYS